MHTLCKAIAWAFAIIAMAWAGNSGLISESSATSMVAVMPALAVISIRGGNCWSLGRRDA